MTGMDLKVERVRAGVRQTDLARVMGRSRVTLLKYETAHEVRPEVIDAYRAALLTLTGGKAA